MSFPPLPPSTLYDAGQCLNGHNNDALRAYGQSCREHALEDAAMAAEDGFKYALDGYQIADKIRSLK